MSKSSMGVRMRSMFFIPLAMACAGAAVGSLAYLYWAHTSQAHRDLAYAATQMFCPLYIFLSISLEAGTDEARRGFVWWIVWINAVLYFLIPFVYRLARSKGKSLMPS